MGVYRNGQVGGGGLLPSYIPVQLYYTPAYLNYTRKAGSYRRRLCVVIQVRKIKNIRDFRVYACVCVYLYVCVWCVCVCVCRGYSLSSPIQKLTYQNKKHEEITTLF